MDVFSYVIDDGLIMIPVLYIIGEIFKHTTPASNRLIPLILLVFSLGFTPILLGSYSPENIVQAVLVAGVTVFGNELVKQTLKGNDKNG